jgi:hypothetical protein
MNGFFEVSTVCVLEISMSVEHRRHGKPRIRKYECGETLRIRLQIEDGSFVKLEEMI